MRRKSEIQTAVNVQSGGVNEGLVKSWYHSDTDVLVIAPPIVDTPRLSATQKANPQMSRHHDGDCMMIPALLDERIMGPL
jgi:hypothetical protein